MDRTRRATQPQIDYVRGLQHRLRLTSPMLDAHCTTRFGRSFAELDRGQASALIDELTTWVDVPANLQRAFGQLDMFEMLT